jgi:hypothetical protein
MQQLLFLPAYQSVYPSLTRTAAQPHRAHPPYSYEPTTHATETFPTLSSKLAMERRMRTFVHGRPFFADSRVAALQLHDRVASLSDRLGLRRNPKKDHWEPTKYASTSDSKSTPQSLLSLGTISHCYTLPDPTATLRTRCPVANCPTARSARRKSVVPLPGHSDSPLLPPRTARRPRYAHWMGRTGTSHLSAENETSSGGRKYTPPTTAAPSSIPPRPPTCTATSHVTAGEQC